ncbi:hypothetical protein LTR95_002290 [Oleoguttula sp. CCFEE 5521]
MAAMEQQCAGCARYAHEEQCIEDLRRTSEAQYAQTPQSPSSSTHSTWRSRSVSPGSAASPAKRKKANFTKHKRRSRDMLEGYRIINSMRSSDPKACAKNWRKTSREKVVIGPSSERTPLLNSSPTSSYGTSSDTGVSPTSSAGVSGRSSPDYILGATGQVIALYDSGVFLPASAPSSPLDHRASTVTLWSRTARMLRGSGETEDEEAVVGVVSRNEYPQDVTKWIFLTWAGWYVLLLVLAMVLCWVGTVSMEWAQGGGQAEAQRT